MDLSTRYLGFDLPHPLMPGASPLTDDLDMVRRLEDAGASALVLRSLFEEQMVQEELATRDAVDVPAESFAEALSFLPEPDAFVLGPEEYLEHLRRVKESVAIPVIASLNGTSPGAWVEYARLVEQAGADALELNVYDVVTDPSVTSLEVENQALSLVRAIQEQTKLPVALKLSSFYSSLANFAQRLDEAKVDGLVLFNRIFVPDFDLEELRVVPRPALSHSAEIALRLRWLGILSDRVEASLAVTGGVHTELDAIKAVMAGADAVQLVTALLRTGPDHIRIVRERMIEWLEENEYESLQQMRGSMNLRRCPNPESYKRAHYLKVLQTWKAET